MSGGGVAGGGAAVPGEPLLEGAEFGPLVSQERGNRHDPRDLAGVLLLVEERPEASQGDAHQPDLLEPPRPRRMTPENKP